MSKATSSMGISWSMRWLRACSKESGWSGCSRTTGNNRGQVSMVLKQAIGSGTFGLGGSSLQADALNGKIGRGAFSTASLGFRGSYAYFKGIGNYGNFGTLWL